MNLPHPKNAPLILFIMSAVILASCLRHDEVEQQSIYKQDILNYLTQLDKSISGARAAANNNINDLMVALDFTKVKTYKLRTTEQAIIADLKPINSFGKTSKLKAVFFLNQNEIVRSTIVAFNDKTPGNYDQVILSVLNIDKRKNDYSGRISFYSPLQQLLLFDDFENGILKTNGIARTKSAKNKSGKVESCVDWYLVTTNYYSDGTTSIKVEFLYTDCGDGGCEEQGSRYGRIGCTGSGGSGTGTSSAPSFPSVPVNSDVYEFTDKDGKYTKYVFDSSINTWVIMETILPPFVVQSQPDNYPFLQIRWPVNGQVVYGTDYLAYTYNGSSGDWEGELYIVPSGPGTIITNKSLYLQCFDTNNSATVTIYVDQPNPGTRDVINGSVVGHAFIGISQTQNNGSITVTRIFGFYPETFASPLKTSDVGVLKVDEGHGYDISLSISLTPDKLSQLISYITSNNRSYDLSTYNCSSYDLSVANNVLSLSLPATTGCWLPNSPSGCGNNPGDLGEDLRNKPGAISSPNSHAPFNSGCPADLP